MTSSSTALPRNARMSASGVAGRSAAAPRWAAIAAGQDARPARRTGPVRPARSRGSRRRPARRRRRPWRSPARLSMSSVASPASSARGQHRDRGHADRASRPTSRTTHAAGELLAARQARASSAGRPLDVAARPPLHTPMPRQQRGRRRARCRAGSSRYGACACSRKAAARPLYTVTAHRGGRGDSASTTRRGDGGPAGRRRPRLPQGRAPVAPATEQPGSGDGPHANAAPKTR